jgi:hypothetical protein
LSGVVIIIIIVVIITIIIFIIILMSSYHGLLSWNRTHEHSRVKNALGTKPCVFSGKVASVAAGGRSLFPRVRASI